MHPVGRRQILPLHTIMARRNTKSMTLLFPRFFFRVLTVELDIEFLEMENKKWLRPYSKPTFLCGIRKSSGAKEALLQLLRSGVTGMPCAAWQQQLSGSSGIIVPFSVCSFLSSCLQVYRESIEMSHFGLAASQVILPRRVAQYTHT